MRYEVNKEYVFLRDVYTTPDEHKRFFSGLVYMPWYDTLQKTKLVLLKCAEHHKVPFYDPNAAKDHDGFIFEELASMESVPDDKSLDVIKVGGVPRRWSNQYPTSYDSQLSDTNDWIVQRITTDDENELAKAREMDMATVDMLLESYTDALKYLANIKNTLDGYKAENAKLDAAKIGQLQVHQQFVTEAVEKITMKKIRYETLTFTYKDGRPPENMPDFFTAKLAA